MIIGVAVWGATVLPVSYIADRCAQAHHDLNRGGFRVEVSSKSVFSSERTTYNLTYDRSGQADLAISGKRPFRVVVTNDNVYEFDPTTKQYAEKIKAQEDIDATVRRSAGNLDELVASLMNPSGVGVWLKSFRIGRLWTLSQGSDELVLSSTIPDSRTEIVLDGDSYLLKRVVNKSNGFGTEWRFSSLPVKPIAFRAPEGSFKVKELMPSLVAPTYASASAKRVCEKVFARYDRPKTLSYLVKSADETFQVWIDQGRVRQRDAESDWALASGKFTLADQRGQTLYSGKATMTKIVDTVNKTGSRVEPLLKLLLRGINPFRFYLGQNASVRVAGTAKIGGEPCSILESTSSTGKLSLVARDRDGFVLSLVSVPKGSDTASTREFKPLPPGQDFAVAAPSGWFKKSLD